MFDTMTMTKIVGALCGALLVFLVGNWAASALYDTSGGGGHGDEAHAAYVIDTGEDEGGGEEEETGPTFAEALAAADSAKGEKAWGKCKACHKLEDGANGTGPHLYNVVGRDVASVDGFGYSDALNGIEGDWTPEQLSAWLESPKDFAPGNKMTYNGMSKQEDRANLIAYLIDNSPDYVPAEPAAAEEPAAEEQAAAEGAEEPAAEDGAAEEPAAEEGAAEEQAAEEAAAEEPAAEEGAAEEGAADEGAAEEQAAEEGAAEEPAGDSPIAAAVAAADIAAGEKAYRKCKACHVVDKEQNRVGPHLVGLVGRDIASVEDFKYSDALTALEGTWTPEALDAWLADPKGYAPGNKMSFAGMKDIEDRANVIAYIESQGQ